MKKLIFCVFLLAAIGATATAPPEVNEKVLKAFNETFIKATDVVWHEMQDSYEAHFKQSQIVTRATYDTEGNLLKTIRYYSEEHLPINILMKLKKKYSGKTVFGVTESTSEEAVSYHITLEDDKNWYIVIADNWGSLELSRKFQKA